MEINEDARFWLMWTPDPTENRLWGIVDEVEDGIIAYALTEDFGDMIVKALEDNNAH